MRDLFGEINEITCLLSDIKDYIKESEADTQILSTTEAKTHFTEIFYNLMKLQTEISNAQALMEVQDGTK